MSTTKSISKQAWKSGALALILGAAMVLPVVAQPGYGVRRYRTERRFERRNRIGRVFTGTVVRRHSDFQFDLRVNGRTYNVYTDARLPRRLDRDDLVRVWGRRVGNNDIRNATVEVIRNR